ncbi:unnamed protein product [Darwinula stevensoni]|uniref:RNA polymerase II elongation factor ELL N-terminal domain-containing protein n=1 Tax=Darwinula stevensoni TaxID=69355 RepID=A0A7R9AAL2_9CRUS|nr:unnamed protein product [Darwinula stevensoni]CAG0898349.1 unnamed protein product [Darwinula stevensoni]
MRVKNVSFLPGKATKERHSGYAVYFAYKLGEVEDDEENDEKEGEECTKEVKPRENEGGKAKADKLEWDSDCLRAEYDGGEEENRRTEKWVASHSQRPETVSANVGGKGTSSPLSLKGCLKHVDPSNIPTEGTWTEERPSQNYSSNLLNGKDEIPRNYFDSHRPKKVHFGKAGTDTDEEPQAFRTRAINLLAVIESEEKDEGKEDDENEEEINSEIVALPEGEHYTISRRRNSGKKSFLFVELTNSVFRALEDFRSRSRQNEEIKIHFSGDEGRILIPGVNGNLQSWKFSFGYISGTDSPEVNSFGSASRSLETLSPITILLKEDGYKATRLKIAEAKEESNNRTKVIRSSDLYILQKVEKPATPLLAPASSKSPSQLPSNKLCIFGFRRQAPTSTLQTIGSAALNDASVSSLDLSRIPEDPFRAKVQEEGRASQNCSSNKRHRENEIPESDIHLHRPKKAHLSKAGTDSDEEPQAFRTGMRAINLPVEIISVASLSSLQLQPPSVISSDGVTLSSRKESRMGTNGKYNKNEGGENLMESEEEGIDEIEVGGAKEDEEINQDSSILQRISSAALNDASVSSLDLSRIPKDPFRAKGRGNEQNETSVPCIASRSKYVTTPSSYLPELSPSAPLSLWGRPVQSPSTPIPLHVCISHFSLAVIERCDGRPDCSLTLLRLSGLEQISLAGKGRKQKKKKREYGKLESTNSELATILKNK